MSCELVAIGQTAPDGPIGRIAPPIGNAFESKKMTRLLLAVMTTLLVNIGWAAGEAAAAQGQTVKGEVLEAKDVDAYTYLRLKTKEGELWAAVNKAPVKKGAQVTVENAMVMSNFKSKALGKTFDRIVFGTLAGTGAASGGGDLGQIHRGAVQAPGVADVAVPKAQGADARTVAEIYGNRAELKDKTILLRGKVVKVTLAVMGKNWLHLRDGTGKEPTNDLTVTTQAKTKVGDTVLVEGAVTLDKDFGAGYKYDVIIEDAKVKIE